jgi:hypothetical protein
LKTSVVRNGRFFVSWRRENDETARENERRGEGEEIRNERRRGEKRRKKKRR